VEFTHQHMFAASLDRVVEMLADEGFAHERARASGAADGEAWVDGTAATAFTVSIRRSVPATSIPSEFRSFVGKDLHVRYTEAWEAPSGDDRIGTFAVEIVGAPGHVGGALGLTPLADGTEFLATGEVKVSIPLFGSIVERAVMDAVLKGLSLELAAADEWLTS
jgi:hypothetical protein